jgi:hypothetical protein
MFAGRSPRMIFSHQKRLVDPKFPKYMPFTRKNSFIALKFNIPLSPQPASPTGTTQPTTQPVLSLQASCPSHGRPFAGLAFHRVSECPKGAIISADAHEHAKVMSNTSVGDGLHGGADGLVGDDWYIGLKDDADDAHITSHGVANVQMMPMDMTTNILNGDMENQAANIKCVESSPTTMNKQEQTTSAAHASDRERREDIRDQPLPRAGVIASSSDNLFHPVSDLPPSCVFTLPNFPQNPCYHTYNHSPSALFHPLPYPSISSSSSYNNPLQFVSSQPTYFHPPCHQIQPVHPFAQPTYQITPLHTFSLSPSHSPSPGGAVSINLPIVTHIPVLTSKTDFFPWDEGVLALIRANGLIGHILDPSVYVDPSRPDLTPTPAPVLSTISSAQQIEALNLWWAADNIVQYILVSRLGSTPRSLLPSANTISRTALSIYQTLTRYYGTCSFADCTELLHSLHNSTCTSGRVPEFVSRWRVGISKLQSARLVFNIKICISMFVRGLPHIPAFYTLRADLPHRIAAVVDDRDCGAFIDLTDTVLELDTIFRPTPQLRASRPPRAPSVSDASVPVSPASSSLVPKKKQTCANCKLHGFRGIGHTDVMCFYPGGGMSSLIPASSTFRLGASA